jgi:hypothetical protein
MSRWERIKNHFATYRERYVTIITIIVVLILLHYLGGSGESCISRDAYTCLD